MAKYYYQKIRCPYCDSIVRNSFRAGQPLEKDKIEWFGFPFQRCNHCGRFYVDSNCRERACRSDYGVKYYHEFRNKTISNSLKKEIAESIARLLNKDYALRLRDAGFNVPRMYISPTKKDLELLDFEIKEFGVTQLIVEQEKIRLEPLLHREKRTIADGWECPICGKINSERKRICCSCKYNINPNGWECPICGKINNEGDTNCTECGFENF